MIYISTASHKNNGGFIDKGNRGVDSIDSSSLVRTDLNATGL